jgi:hypothetical protein
MTRSRFSIKSALLAGGIGLSMAGFAGSQPAVAQSYSACPTGYVYDPAYGCTLPGDAYEPDAFGYYGYLPYGTYGPYYGGHREFGYGFGHGMGAEGSIVHHGMGFGHSIGFPHSKGGGFGHGIGGGFGHGIGFAHAGGFGHGMAGGFHGGGGGHR